MRFFFAINLALLLSLAPIFGPQKACKFALPSVNEVEEELAFHVFLFLMSLLLQAPTRFIFLDFFLVNSGCTSCDFPKTYFLVLSEISKIYHFLSSSMITRHFILQIYHIWIDCSSGPMNSLKKTYFF